MAKALAYNRAAQQVVLVDTVNNAVIPLGNAIIGPSPPAADQTSGFPGRSENLVALFLGQPYFLYRDVVGTIRLLTLSAGVWTAVAGFNYTAGSGTLTPICLQVDRNKLVAILHLSNSAGTDGDLCLTSTDGVTWGSTYTLTAPVQPAISQGGHSIVWRNTVFFATSGGIGWYAPGIGIGFAYDTGSSGNLADPNTPLGHFAFWNGSLYFVKAGSLPTIYKLVDTWDPVAPTTAPAWTQLSATGLSSVGTIATGPDASTLLAFVSPTDNFCIAYSGQLGTKLVQATSVAFPSFKDVTLTMLPAPLPTSADLGFSLFTDDRKRTNELQTLIIRDLPVNDTILASWDGVTLLTIRNTFIGIQLMPPDARFGELRTYTAQQPTCFISSVTQPFPGRTAINYTVIDSFSRSVDVFGEYSISGDVWSPMTEGAGDSGSSLLATAPGPGGLAHTFFWDTFADLDGNLPFAFMRIVARISSP